jgi:hypothetical protein
MFTQDNLKRRISSMAIHKLRNGPVTMQVSAAAVVDGKYGSQVKFSGTFLDDDNADLYISERSAVGQLERIGLTVDTCVGELLHFEHVHKDDRTYTNIKRVTADGSQQTQEAPQATKATGAPTSSTASPINKYEECLGIAIMHCEGLAEQGWSVETSDLIAMAATLFIQASRR